MFYFVPSWYGEDRPFFANPISWVKTSQRIEFDDTINQLKIFQGAGQETSLLLLHYFPQLRYFLHRNDLLELPYHSIFDHIQGIGNLPMRCVQLQDFIWDPDVYFVYTPFLVIARRGEERVATVEYGVDGNIIQVNSYEENCLVRQDILDDRGFISSIIYWDQEAPYRQEYLCPDGKVILTEFLTPENQSILINLEFADQFDRWFYPNMEALVKEQYARFLEQEAESSDTLVLAASPVHNGFAFDLAEDMRLVLSTYHSRISLGDDTLSAKLVKQADLILTDSQKEKILIQDKWPHEAQKVHRQASFDTRLQLGMSQQRKESKLFYYINTEEDFNQEKMIAVLKLLATNDLLEVVIGTYNADYWKFESLKEQVGNVVSSHFRQEELYLMPEPDEIEADGLVEPEEVEAQPRYQVKNFNDELAIIQELEMTRLILDLSLQPNLYTQIAGISAGIPQINMIETEYVEHLKNGYILEGLEDLPSALTYYLETLKAWNESLIYSVQKIKENTGLQMVQKWEGWLRESRHGR